MSSTLTLPSADRDEQLGLIQDLREAYTAFTRDELSPASIQHLRKGARSFLGINSNLEGNIDLWRLRQDLLTELDCEDVGVLQVVGDSGVSFEERSIPRALQILSEQVKAESIVQYGYTAVKYDTNWLVAEHIQQSLHEGSRTIANIVEQSIECLQNPLWQGSPSVTNFVVLYEHKRSTNFGDDVWLSDGIMFADSNDKLLCFEGGLQAFRQCINMLLKEIPVMLVTGLRSMDASTKFSAAQCLECLKMTNKSTVNSQVDKYLDRVFGEDDERVQVAERLVMSLLNSVHDWKSLISIL